MVFHHAKDVAAAGAAGAHLERISEIVGEVDQPSFDCASLGVHELARHRRGPGRRTIHRVKLTPELPTYIGPAMRRYDPWSITCVHYYTSGPDDKIAGLIRNGRKLVFTVQASDAMSGTTVLKRYLFGSEDLIKGYFEGRRGFRIIARVSYDSSDTGQDDIAQQETGGDK